MDVVVILPAIALVAFLAGRGLRIWLDSGEHGWGPARRLGWALWGALAPGRYWWSARIAALAPEEQAGLLARETAALGLSRADGLRCPLCSSEVPGAWTVTSQGEPAIGPEPVQCPACDFRLDVCRHCAHFLPGMPTSWAEQVWSQADETSGRCSFYRRSLPVDDVVAPDLARQLRARGYDEIRGPVCIVDSFVRPDFCRAFRVDRKRLKAGGVRWPDARRTALLRLLSPLTESL